MEVTVLETKNTPATPVLAVQVGASPLRQAGLEVGRPFLVPRSGEGAELPVEVVLFNQMANAALPDGCTETSCSVPVKKPDGSSGEVKLSVRRTAPKSGAAADATVGPKPGNDYLDKHGLTEKVQGLIEEVLRDQPDDPFRFMLDRLRKSKEPLVPKPPDGPPNGNKAPVRRSLNKGSAAAQDTSNGNKAYSERQVEARMSLDACYNNIAAKS